MNNDTPSCFFIYSGKTFPKNSIRKNFLLGITKAPGAGS